MTNTKTTTQTYPQAVEDVIVCRPWHDRPRCRARVRVDADGTVRVWDSCAGHYTLVHSLSPRTCRRIFREVYPSVA